jgi:hypothetical protein
VEIANAFNVSERAFNEWKRLHPKFVQSLIDGREKADAKVARSLYERARGYSHDAVKIFMPAGATEPIYAPYTEHYPPDTGAASLWLKNRQRAKWRERLDVEHTVTLRSLILESMGEVIEGEVVRREDGEGK